MAFSGRAPTLLNRLLNSRKKRSHPFIFELCCSSYIHFCRIQHSYLFKERRKTRETRTTADPRSSPKLQQRQKISSAARKIPACYLLLAQCRLRLAVPGTTASWGISAACVPASSPPPHPHALNLAEKLPCPASVHKRNRPHIHTPQISSVPGKMRLQGCQKALEQRGWRASLSSRILLHCHGLVKYGECVGSPAKKWTGCYFPSAPCLHPTPAPLPGYVQVAVGWAK